MWKGWISLLVALWLILSGAVPALQDQTIMMVIGGLLLIIGFIKLKTWHGPALSFVGLGILLSSTVDASGSTFYFVLGVIIAFLGVMIVKVNLPDLSKSAN